MLPSACLGYGFRWSYQNPDAARKTENVKKKRKKERQCVAGLFQLISLHNKAHKN